MLKTKRVSEEDVLNMIKLLPKSKRIEVLDLLDSLIRRDRKGESRRYLKRAVSAIEDTWGSIKLDRETFKYIAEDKEIEYDV